MAHQIVATSVPRGLDGVSGYQTVLKSVGIPPRVFDRLKARSGYSHRYPHGDSRNPVVYLHRIEELGGSRWHVLGCVRDAGSDHTGRSNFLAHMLAIDAAEARGKVGGPASAAMTRGCFLDKWDGPPDGAAPSKTLVAADHPPQSGDMPAWRQVGLDPGLAGDLAAAAMASRKVVIVTRPGDDVLALFADALRLVEPSKRWAVTFNTCAIEDFDGIWKAIRADLADAKDSRDSKAAVIDLTANPRGSDDPYARFARGEAELLPWQKRAEPVGQGVAEEEQAAEIRPGSGRAAVGKDRPDELRRKPRAARDGKARERRSRYREEETSGSPWRWVVLTIGGLLFVAGLVAIPFRDQLFGLSGSSQQRHFEPERELAAEPVKPPPVDPTETAKGRRLQQLEDARKRLLAGVDGKTHDTLREEAEELQKRIKPADHPGRDLGGRVKGVIDICDQVAAILESSSAKVEEVTNKHGELKKAVAEFEELSRSVGDLEETARKELAKKKMEAEVEELRQRQEKAFQQLQSLVKDVDLPTASEAAGIDDGSRPAAGGVAGKIDLGAFAVTDLVEPKFRLAVPRDEVKGSEFRAAINKIEAGPESKWEIRYVPPGVALDGGKSGSKPRSLAFLIARDGRLWLEVPRSNELAQSPFALLRRSVILVEARDPAAPAAPAVVHEIRLVRPTTAKPLEIDLFGENRQEMKINPPKGISRSIGGTEGNAILELPNKSLRFSADFPKGEKVNLELPHHARQLTDSGIGEWDLPLVELSPDLGIQAVIKLSLPQAMMTVKTEFTGPRAAKISMDTVKRNFVDKPAEVLENLKRSFEARVKEGEGFGFIEKQTKHGTNKIRGWFEKPLVTKERVGISMPGHETIQSSFEAYLKERYAAAPEGKKKALPENWLEFLDACTAVTDATEWKDVFSSRVSAWAEWFWPQFEAQWEDTVKLLQGAAAEQHEIRITAITSLAYDEAGKVYEVPLVKLGEPDAAKEDPGNSGRKSSRQAVGLD